jgi:hypothetical protein
MIHGMIKQENSTSGSHCIYATAALFAALIHGAVVHVTLELPYAQFALEFMHWSMEVEII